MNNKKKNGNVKDKPWFDEDCKNIKIETAKLAKAYRRTPKSVEVREKIFILTSKSR